MTSARPLIEASVLLAPGTAEWPGDTPYSCGWTWRIADGASVNVSSLTMSPHVGTHADAPVHVRDGTAASDALPAHAFVGEAVVLDVSDVPATAAPDGAGAITLAALTERADRQGVRLAGVTRLLLRTGRTIADGRFPAAWPWLDPDAARVLVSDGLLLLGVDAPSVDAREARALVTHHALFDGGACNLESLDLRAAGPGRFELYAAPLRIAGLDAAPARALLRRLA